MLTPRELQQIRDYFLQYGKKDTQLPVLENMTGNDLIAFVRNNQNFTAHLDDIEEYIGSKIAIDGIEIEGITMGLTEENFTTLLKDKLGDIEPNAQVNKIETVKVNGISTPITSKSVDIELIPTSYVKNYSDPEHPVGELGNQLLGERDINAKIAEMDATYLGTCTDSTEAGFKTYLDSKESIRNINDYVFWQVPVVDEEQQEVEGKYIYRRYKYTGISEDQFYKGWHYEYEMLPYYINTDDYPTAGSTNAVASQGIFAFTGDVHKDGNNNYIPLQDQVDDVNGTIYNLHATPSFVISPSSFLIKEGTVSPSSLSAVAKIEFNGVNESPNNYSVSLNNQNWTVTKDTVNNVYTCTRNTAITDSETVAATFTKGSSFSKTKNASIIAYYPIYYGVTNESSNPANITTSSFINSVKTTTANTGYSVTTTTTNKYFFIAVPKAKGTVVEPSQYSLTPQYDSPGNLTSLGNAYIEINNTQVQYKFFISAPQTAGTNTYYTK